MITEELPKMRCEDRQISRKKKNGTNSCARSGAQGSPCSICVVLVASLPYTTYGDTAKERPGGSQKS